MTRNFLVRFATSAVLSLTALCLLGASVAPSSALPLPLPTECLEPDCHTATVVMNAPDALLDFLFTATPIEISIPKTSVGLAADFTGDVDAQLFWSESGGFQIAVLGLPNIPEPGTALLTGLGLLMLGWRSSGRYCGRSTLVPTDG